MKGVKIISMLGLEEDNDIGIFGEESKDIFSIIPKKGSYLGLDISKNSTGISLVEDGNLLQGNIVLEPEKGVHKEVLLRRQLSRYLRELLEGKKLDVVVIEDVFIGENASTSRTLFALNTAIDELILDGICEVKDFVRVSNKLWKSKIFTLDTTRASKGYNDKERINYCLGLLGVKDSGDGFQDRLDSLGLLVSYFIEGGILDEGINNIKVRFSDIEASYEIDSSYLFYGRDDLDRGKIQFIDYTNFSKKKIIKLLSKSPDTIFVSSNSVYLGNLGVDLGLDSIEDGGYFAFWVKPKKLSRYLKEVI